MTDDQGTPPAAVTAAEVKTVDYETYQRVVQAKTNLESQVNSLKAERDGALEKASTVDSVVQDRDSWKAKAEQESTRFGRYQAIAATTGNSDPEAMELVEYAYGRVPEEGRPELADWLTGFKADPSTAPLALRSVFEQATPAAPIHRADPPRSHPRRSWPFASVRNLPAIGPSTRSSASRWALCVRSPVLRGKSSTGPRDGPLRSAERHRLDLTPPSR